MLTPDTTSLNFLPYLKKHSAHPLSLDKVLFHVNHYKEKGTGSFHFLLCLTIPYSSNPASRGVFYSQETEEN